MVMWELSSRAARCMSLLAEMSSHGKNGSGDLTCSQDIEESMGKCVHFGFVPSGATWLQYFTLGQFHKGPSQAAQIVLVYMWEARNKITCNKNACRKLLEHYRQSKVPRIHQFELDISEVYFIRIHEANCKVSGGLLTPKNHFRADFKTMSAITEY